MGYYANGSGNLVFARALSDKEYDRILEALLEAFECDGVQEEESLPGIVGKGYFDIWNSEKYYGESVETALDLAAQIAPLESGHIDYIGEDGSLWRFVYLRGKWVEQNGHVVYDENDEGTFGNVS